VTAANAALGKSESPAGVCWETVDFVHAKTLKKAVPRASQEYAFFFIDITINPQAGFGSWQIWPPSQGPAMR
jgi:hypothetical protein